MAERREAPAVKKRPRDCSFLKNNNTTQSAATFRSYSQFKRKQSMSEHQYNQDLKEEARRTDQSLALLKFQSLCDQGKCLPSQKLVE